MRRWAIATAAAAGLGLLPTQAEATWSIAAVDAQTQEVGVAVASCVEAPYGTTTLPLVAALAPGIGALAAQAQFVEARRDQALALLEMGLAPQAVIDMTNATDFGAANRQYGVVVLSGETAAFTGDNAQDWAGHRPSIGVTVQGNILYGADVVDDALAAFEARSKQCPWTLADRLMVALEAGSAQGGDNRCSEAQSALAATIQVARPGDEKGAFYLDIRIPSQPMGGDNPVVLLREAYDLWRADNPPDDSMCGGGSSSGGAADDSTGAPGGDSGAGSDDDGGPVTTAPGPSTSGGDEPGPAGSSSAPASDSSGGGSGCGCVAGERTSWALAWSSLVLVALRRRRAATFRPT